MVKKSLIGIGVVALIAYLFIRNKGGDIISKNNVFEKMEFPKMEFPKIEFPKIEFLGDFYFSETNLVATNLITAKRETITQLQNILEIRNLDLESLRLATPLVVKEIYESRPFGWRNDRIIKVIVNPKEIEASLRFHKQHLAKIDNNLYGSQEISNDIRQLQKEVDSL